jgi:hypothetical protein
VIGMRPQDCRVHGLQMMTFVHWESDSLVMYMQHRMVHGVMHTL